MNKPFQIEVGEWWFKGCFIQEQNHPQLGKYVIFKDTEDQEHIGIANKFTDAVKLCKENEVTEYKLGIEAFGFKQPLTKKHKTYSITRYYKGVELTVLCVTVSKKKFAELMDLSISYVNNYANCYDLRYPLCNENPDKLYAKRGMGGEAMFIFDKNEVKTFEEYKELVEKHREIYPTSFDYYESKDKENKG
jgi:hypothetical protein